LDDLNWPEKVKLMQKHWIGRSEGAEIDFQVVDSDYKLTVFTTRADTLAGCTFIVIAADHDLAAQLIKETEKEAVLKYLEKSKYLTDRDKQLDKEKDGVFTGSFVKNPLSEREIPVFLANYVLKNYGTGIVMGVPAHDQRDFDFAKKMDLKIVPVIAPPDNLGYLFSGYDENPECAFEGEGTLFNSGKFNELDSHKIAIDAIVSHLEKEGLAKKVFHYKLRDWIFSRQRYWGEPIPLVHCKDCGIVPVPESELPLVLPPVESYQPTGTGESPLAAIESWVNTPCPKCSSPAKRETNTMPQWAGSCWYFLRYPDVDLPDAIANPETLKYWLPVDLYVGGIEHAVLHLLYARFYIKFLHEIGVVPFKEPFQKLFNQGMVCMKSSISGRVEKMSKSKGNVVNPDDIVSKLGSDTLRMYMLFMGPPELDTEWQTESINGVHKFLHRLWTFLTDPKNLISGSADITSQKRFHLFLKLYSERLADYKVNTAVSAIMEYLNDLVKFSLKLDRQLMRDLWLHFQLWFLIFHQSCLR
jgi:leucyl-tRNA synthetase